MNNSLPDLLARWSRLQPDRCIENTRKGGWVLLRVSDGNWDMPFDHHPEFCFGPP